jgi:hypothetical protein
MDPATIGAITSGIGSIASAFGNKSSSDGFSKKGYGQYLQMAEGGIPFLTRLETKAKLQNARKYGEQYGIHPLAALGVSTGSFSAPTPVGTSSGSSIGDAIAGAGHAYSQYAHSRADKLAQRKAENRQIALDISNMRESDARTNANNAQAAYYQAQADLVTQQAANSLTKRAQVDANSSQDVIKTPFGSFQTGNTTPQQDFEDHYGGILGEGYGLIRFGHDSYNNAKPRVRKFLKSVPPRAKKFYKDNFGYRPSRQYKRGVYR